MKVRAQAAAALAIAGASAQSSSSITAAPVSYTTVTYDDCPTADIATMITVTNGITVTYCPECMHESSTSKGPGHTTVYTTTYLSLCPTGTVPVTYTVTESCDEPTPTWTPGPSHVPQGFTVTVKQCSVCEGGEKTPIPVTITEPCDCEATSGTWVGPKPTGTPIQQISDGQIQNPAPTPGGSGGEPAGPAPTGGNVPSGPGSGNSGTAPPYPTGSATTVQCPGPECRAKATGGAAGPSDIMPISSTTPAEGGSSPAPSGSTSDVPPAPYEGGAVAYREAGFVTFSVVVAALAFAL